MKQPLILVTNDDGIAAPGIKALIEVASEFGKVVVVAPDSPQSGKGHGITISDPLRINKVSIYEDHIEAYESSGTPVDCVKLAVHVPLKDRQKPDLCISGINHGSNASINILYSGTMSAAMEAAMEGIPSIGFSLMDFSFDADFTAAKVFARKIIKFALEKPLKPGQLLNVNIPKLPEQEISGIKVCRQAKGHYTEEFAESTDPRGQKYYWLTGVFTSNDERLDTDIKALENGYVSVVPSKFDLTDEDTMKEIRDLN